MGPLGFPQKHNNNNKRKKVIETMCAREHNLLLAWGNRVANRRSKRAGQGQLNLPFQFFITSDLLHITQLKGFIPNKSLLNGTSRFVFLFAFDDEVSQVAQIQRDPRLREHWRAGGPGTKPPSTQGQ